MHEMNETPASQNPPPWLWLGLGLGVLLIAGAILLVAYVLPGLSSRPMEAVITPREATRNAQVSAASPTSARTTPVRTPTGAGTVRTPTRVASANLPAGYTLFESTIYPYTIGYPDDWPAQGEFEIEDVKADTFIGSEANVNILGEPDLKSVGLETLMSALIRENEAEGATDVERLDNMRIDGQRALVVRWTDSGGGGLVQVVWITSTHGWVATLYAADGDVERHLPLFREMLGTLRHKVP